MLRRQRKNLLHTYAMNHIKSKHRIQLIAEHVMMRLTKYNYMKKNMNRLLYILLLDSVFSNISLSHSQARQLVDI